MRRPLAAALLLFAASVRLVTLAFPLPVPGPEYGDGQTAVYTGEVADITGYTDSGTGEALQILYLKHALPEERSQTDAWQSDAAPVIKSGDDAREGASSGTFPFKDNPSSDNSFICRPESGEIQPEIGSYIRCEGTVRHFRQATNPGEFDAKKYYNRQGYAFELTDARIIGKSREFSHFRQALFLLKQHMGRALEALLPGREASVAKAMLLGEKKGMDQELKSLYQDAGISHVLAISGLHISLLGMGVYRLLSRLTGKRAGCICACAFLAAYLCMTGLSASSLRAGIGFLFVMAAQLMGRTCDSATALSVAAAGLLAGNPAWLEDAGFGLSFSAALGAVAVLPAFEEMEDTGKWLRRHRKAQAPLHPPGRLWTACMRIRNRKWLPAGKIKSGFQASFCISLATLPVLLATGYEWNLFSVLLNVIVVPLMGILLGGCILLAVAGGILLAAAPGLMGWLKPLALPVRAILWLYEYLCRMGGQNGTGLIRTGSPALWQSALFVTGLVLLLWKARGFPKIAGYGGAMLLCLIFLADPFRGPQLTMLDVGQGDCIYIRTGAGKHYLYDAGSSSKRNTGTFQVIPFLKYQGVRRLELIFVSHWDGDHISAVQEILAWAGEGKLQVGGLVLSASGPEDDSFRRLGEAAASARIPVYRMGAGDEIRDGTDRFLALYPTKGMEIQDRNAASLVLRYSMLRKGQELFSALLTGDIGQEEEALVLEEYGSLTAPCSLLKTAHHGSDTATGEAFLDRALPRLALISCGKDNSYGHPHAAVLERFAIRRIPVFITAECGAVTVRFGGGKIRVEAFLDRRFGFGD